MIQTMYGNMPYANLMSATTASDRVEFRIAPELKEELEAASAMLGLSTSAFVKDVAVRTARQMIQQERQISLGADAWEKFAAAIDRPGEFSEGFAELLRRPSVFSAE